MAKALKKNTFIEGEVVDRTEERLRVVDGGAPTNQDPLEKEFKLKSEFFEKNVKLPDLKKDKHEGPITQVKVYHETGVDIVNPGELKKFVKENKDIRQVVVEKISIDEATRISLLFEPKHHASQFVTLVEDQIDRLERNRVDLLEEEEVIEDEKIFNLDELENLINHDFVQAVPQKEVKESIKDDLAKEEAPDDKTTSEKLKFKWPKSKTEEDEKEKSSFSTRPELKLKSQTLKEDIESEKDVNKTTNNNLSLKLKNSEGNSGKKVNYEKHTFTRKKNKSGHGYYYRAKDHVELFKVGSSFLKDFRSGLKSFSFSSIGLKEEREKSVLGILSFFNYHEDVNICVITPSLKESYYSRIATKAKKRQAQVFDEDLHYEFYTGDGFEVIEYGELRRIERKITAYNFEDFLDFILDSFDIILWDLPDIEVLDSNKEVYFPIIRSLDNVSFIVGQNKSKISEINEMISYFKRYQIPIKGLLFSGHDKKSKKEKSKKCKQDRGGDK
jgi:hypothetical protein